MRKQNDFKQKYSCIKPEDCEVDKLYSFSLNPQEQPAIQNFYRIKLNTFKDWSDQIENKIKRLHYCQYSLCIEISSNGRLHYHGYIKIKDIAKFYMYDIKLLKDIGCYEVDHITDPSVWSTYVEKQKRFMEKFCKENEIKYMITNVVNPKDGM